MTRRDHICYAAVIIVLQVLLIRGDDVTTIAPACNGFHTLTPEEPSYRFVAPAFPLGFGDADNECKWFFFTLPDHLIKVEVIDVDLRHNESLVVFDGRQREREKRLGIDVRELAGQAFITSRNSLTIQLNSGRVFKGTAILQVILQKAEPSGPGLLAANPTQCGGTVLLDSATPTARLEATNNLVGIIPAYCLWTIISPASTAIIVRFVDALLEGYDGFMVIDPRGLPLAEFENINSAPYDVLSASNQVICLFDAFAVQSSSFVQLEVLFVDENLVLDQSTIFPLSGGQLSLTEQNPSVAFRSSNFSAGSSVRFASYWFITSTPGSKMRVDFLEMDTGLGVFLDFRSQSHVPLASVSGRMDLDSFVTVDDTLIVWSYADWKNPGTGVALNVSIVDQPSWDSSTTVSSCGGGVDLVSTTQSSLVFSTPHYGSNVEQFTVCYWYFTSPPDTRVQLEFTDIQTEQGYVYVYDSVNFPAVAVSSIAGEGVLPPFQSLHNGVVVLYNDMASSRNGRGLLASVRVIPRNTPRPESSCGGQIALDASQASNPIKTPWYDAPNAGLQALTSCYWYVTCPESLAVSFEITDIQTVEATVSVYDSEGALQNQIATVKGGTVPSPFFSSGAGMVIQFSDFLSSSPERGFSAVLSSTDLFTWDETTILRSCGGFIHMYPTSTSLTFTSPSYSSPQPDDYFDCMWLFTGDVDRAFRLDVIDLDTSQSTYLNAFDDERDNTQAMVAELSGSDVATAVVTSGGALYLMFSDHTMAGTERGFRAKVTLSVPPPWDHSGVVDSCGGGIVLDFSTRNFHFTTPNFPATFGDHFDCRWYARSPSDTVVAVDFFDFESDLNSFLTVHDGDSIDDHIITRVSGSSFPGSVNATQNVMTLRFFSNRASTGRGASLLLKVLGGEAPASPVRLVGGGGRHEGRVEIYHNTVWGTVCDDDWGVDDAIVVCRMMGYRTVINVWPQAHFGEGVGQIWLDDLQCTGNEKHIIDCPHRMPTGSNNCGHSEDAGVTCGEGAVVMCDSNAMTILLDRVLLEHGDAASDVYFVDESCRGYDHDPDTVAISTSFERCSTEMQETEDAITFSNIVTYFEPRSHNGEVITRDSVLHIPVSCSFDRHVILSDGYRPQLGVVSFSEVSYGNFSLELSMYEDANYSDARVSEEREIPLGKPVFFGVTLSAVTHLTLLIESCWATPHPYPFDPAKYRIIDNGCATDPTVRFFFDENNPFFAVFSVDAFSFVGDYEKVFMHCEVVVCDDQVAGSRCTQGCVPQRSRRAAVQQVRGSSSQPHTISNGPIIPLRPPKNVGEGGVHKTFQDAQENAEGVKKMVLMGASGILLAAGVMMAYVTFSKGQRRSKGYQPLSQHAEEGDQRCD